MDACAKPSSFEFLYDSNLPIKAKIEAIAIQVRARERRCNQVATKGRMGGSNIMKLPLRHLSLCITQCYRASAVEYLPEAEAQIEKYTRMGFDKLPICMAKTQYSFSHEAAQKGT